MSISPNNSYAHLESKHLELLEKIRDTCRTKGATLACAESCTGGLIGAMLSALEGSSASFLGGIITYANSAKASLLEVPQEVLSAQGAVSEATVKIMATEARLKLGSTHAVAVSGIAGPGGGGPLKPVGTVWMAIANKTETYTWTKVFPGDRHEVRTQTTWESLEYLLKSLEEY